MSDTTQVPNVDLTNVTANLAAAINAAAAANPNTVQPAATQQAALVTNAVSQHPDLVNHTESIYSYLSNELARFSELVNIVSELKQTVDSVHGELVGKVQQAESWVQKEEKAAVDWVRKEETALVNFFKKK